MPYQKSKTTISFTYAGKNLELSETVEGMNAKVLPQELESFIKGYLQGGADSLKFQRLTVLVTREEGDTRKGGKSLP